jgi:hypothetical protein
MKQEVLRKLTTLAEARGSLSCSQDPPLSLIVGQTNPAHTLTLCLSGIKINIVLPSMSKPPSNLFPSVVYVCMHRHSELLTANTSRVSLPLTFTGAILICCCRSQTAFWDCTMELQFIFTALMCPIKLHNPRMLSWSTLNSIKHIWSWNSSK